MNQQHRRDHLAAILDAIAERGEQPAILAFGPDRAQQYGCDELAERTRRLGCGLRKHGLSPGDHVALVAENSAALITASTSGNLQDFKPGLGIVLEHYRVPVVPTHIEGTYEAMPPGKRTLRRHPIRVRFGAPLHPDDLEKEGEGDEASTRIIDALHTAIARLGTVQN